MKSKIFGGACIVTFILTAATYLPLQRPLEDQNTKGSTLAGETAGHDQTEGPIYRLWNQIKAAVEEKPQATSLAAVGFKGCKWCDKFKEETLPTLVKEGYDVRYVDIKKWKGPKPKFFPTIFFYGEDDKVVYVHKGYMTVDEVKEYLVKPKAKE